VEQETKKQVFGVELGVWEMVQLGMVLGEEPVEVIWGLAERAERVKGAERVVMALRLVAEKIEGNGDLVLSEALGDLGEVNVVSFFDRKEMLEWTRSMAGDLVARDEEALPEFEALRERLTRVFSNGGEGFVVDEYGKVWVARLDETDLLTSEEEGVLGWQKVRGRLAKKLAEVGSFFEMGKCNANGQLQIVAERGEEAEKWLVMMSLGLVSEIVSRYGWQKEDYEDLLQSGIVRLLRAAAKFDPSREIRFSTYAWRWIKKGVQRMRINIEGDWVLEERAYHQWVNFMRTKRSLAKRNQREANNNRRLI